MPDHTDSEGVLPADPRERARVLGRALRAADSGAQEARDRLEGLTALIPGLAFEIHRHPDGGLVLAYLSGACERLLGIPADAAQASLRQVYRVFDSLSRARLRAALRAPAATPGTTEAGTTEAGTTEAAPPPLHLRVRRSGSSRAVWLRVESRWRRWADGTLVWHGVARDITEQREVEAALAASEQKYRSLINMLPVGLVLLDGGRILLVNDAAKEMLAPGGETLLGRKYLDFVPESEISMALRGEAVAPANWRGGATERMGSLRNLAGETLEVVIAAAPTDMGGSAVTQVSLLDMTDIREAERNRIRVERILRDAIESISEGFILFDANDRLVTCNDNYRKLYPETASILLPGVSFGDLVRRGVDTGAVADKEPDPEAWLARRIEAHRNPGAPLEVRRADGLWVRASERRTHDGGIVGIHTDITETKRREEELSSAMQAAELANRTKSEFLANMSHELRTPLNAILGLSEMIKDQMLGPINIPAYAEYGGDINKSGSHLLTLINDILDLSKIEAGKLHVDPVPAAPAEVIDEIGVLLSPIARQKGVSLVTSTDPDVPAKAEFDAMRVRQILLNLGANALKFTKAGGVYVNVRTEERDRGNGAPTTFLRFEVSDTGIGIDPAKIETIFEAFTQADNSTTRQFGGTGLGLAISRRLTDVMGGEIGCDSRLGEGATFWFRIPVTVLEPAKLDEPTDLTGMRVLLIDEDGLTLSLLKGHLEQAGAGVQIAQDGGSGIDKANTASPPHDVVIISNDLPDMDGLEAGRRIERSPDKQFRVLLSDSDETSLRRVAHQAGFRHFLAKPFRPERLAQSIARGFRKDGASTPRSETGPSTVGTAVATGPLSTELPLLVIDDNPMNQMVASRQLKKLGLTCVVGSNGREGLTLLEEHKVCMALVDCSMPEMDGFEFTRRLRQQEAGTGVHLPVVAMTANAFEESAEECFAAGMDDFITKPVMIGQLEQMVEKWAIAPAKAVAAEKAGGNAAAWKQGDPLPIDREKLSQILGDDDDEMLNEILIFFLESSEPLMVRVRAALDAQDARTLNADAHAAKGAARNAAALRLAEAMSALESHAMAADWPALEAMMQEAELAFAEIRAYISSLQ